MDHETTPTSFWATTSEVDYMTWVRFVSQLVYEYTSSSELCAEKGTNVLIKRSVEIC